MGILTGKEIRNEVKRGVIAIDPYEDTSVNAASYDLRLGGNIISNSVDTVSGRMKEVVYNLDVGDTFVVLPKAYYLMHTIERIHTKRHVCVINGKSSLGRLFIMIHWTAGYVDPGFDGQYTLEVSCAFPTELCIGMHIAQVHFYTLSGMLESYQDKGHYVGKYSKGAIHSILKDRWVLK